MRYFTVILPIAGHAIVDVEAEDEASALALALDQGCSLQDIETFEVMEDGFGDGNVCYAPHPWRPEVEANGPVDE